MRPSEPCRTAQTQNTHARTHFNQSQNARQWVDDNSAHCRLCTTKSRVLRFRATLATKLYDKCASHLANAQCPLLTRRPKSWTNTPFCHAPSLVPSSILVPLHPALSIKPRICTHFPSSRNENRILRTRKFPTDVFVPHTDCSLTRSGTASSTLRPCRRRCKPSEMRFSPTMLSARPECRRQKTKLSRLSRSAPESWLKRYPNMCGRGTLRRTM